MNEIVEIKQIGGIKCDNPSCDFRDESVPVEDYKNWLNKPCPICGSNLLTKKDYKSVKRLLSTIKIINKIGKILPIPKTMLQPSTTCRVEWDGSGNPSFSVEAKEN